MSNPLVSVITTVYNSQAYLREAIESILNQTYIEFEFIIINDGSTDNSKDIILSYQDTRIIYIENYTNCGILKSRNRALDSSKGKYIAVIDSDDISTNTRLEKQVSFLNSNPEYGMCGTYFKIIDELGNVKENITFPINDLELRTYLYFGNCFCHSSVMLRAHLAREIKYPVNFPYGEDYALWIEVSKYSKLKTIPTYLTYYRTHKTNVSITKENEMFNNQLKLTQINFRALQIDFNDEELALYIHFINYNYNLFQNKNNLQILEKFLSRIYIIILTKKDLSHPVILNFHLRRWLNLCLKLHNYNILIFGRLFFVNLKLLFSGFNVKYFKNGY